jgi:hypothetical protein
LVYKEFTMSNTKKSLLNENTIRRFMKLAEIDTLSDGFVGGLTEAKITVKEQEDFQGDPAGPDSGESGLGDLTPDDMDMAAAEEPDEASDLTAAVANLMGVISSMTGVDIDVDGGDDEEVELDVEDEDVMQEGDKEKEPAAAGIGDTIRGARKAGESLDEEDKEKEPAAAGIGDTMRGAAKVGRQTTAAMAEDVANYRHALKQEVLRRVQGRIHQERHNDAVADQLSERILQRIKNRR